METGFATGTPPWLPFYSNKQTILGNLFRRDPERFCRSLPAQLSGEFRRAVLLTMQRGKVNLVRREMPIARDGSPGNPPANRITLL
jgi:hypothetical protein